MDREQSNRSLINFAFVVAGVLVYLAIGFLFKAVADAVTVARPFYETQWLQHGLPIFAGVVTFLGMYFNPKVNTYADECFIEIRKVVWPSRKDTIGMTIVCCVMCVVAGLGLGVFDFLASQLIKVFVH